MNLQYLPNELQVGIDVGSVTHSIAIGDGHGNPVQSFEPLDSVLLEKGYKLYNVKLARFKEIFPAPEKSDRFDAQKILELFSLQKHFPIAKEAKRTESPARSKTVPAF